MYDFMGFFTLGSLVAIEVLGTIIYPLYVVMIMIYLLFARSDGDFGNEPDLDDILHDPQNIDEEPQNLDDLHQAETSLKVLLDHIKNLVEEMMCML